MFDNKKNSHFVVIKNNMRRFSSGETEMQTQILSEISKEYNVKLDVVESYQEKDLKIEIKNAVESLLAQIKYLLSESLSTQSTVSIDMTLDELDKFFTVLPRRFLIANNYLQARKNNKTMSLVLIGGKQSVERGKNIVYDYLSWNRNPVYHRIQMEREYFKYVLGNDKRKNEIKNKCGKFVSIVEDIENDAIIVSGLESQVKKASEMIIEIFDKVKNETEIASLEIKKSFLKIIKIALDEVQKNIEPTVLVFRQSNSDDLKVLSWAGSHEFNEQLKCDIENILDEYIEVKIKKNYNILNAFLIGEYLKILEEKYICSIEVNAKMELLHLIASKSEINSIILPEIESISEKIATDFIFYHIYSFENYIRKIEKYEKVTLKDIEKEEGVFIWTDPFPPTADEKFIPDCQFSQILIGIFGKEHDVKNAITLICGFMDKIAMSSSLYLPVDDKGFFYFGQKKLTAKELIESYAPNCTFKIIFNENQKPKQIKIFGPKDEINHLDLCYFEIQKNIEENFEIKELEITETDSIILLMNPNFLNECKENCSLNDIIHEDLTTEHEKKYLIKLYGKKEKTETAKNFILDTLVSFKKKTTLSFSIPPELLKDFSTFGQWVIKSICSYFGDLIHITYPQKIKAKSKLVIQGLSVFVNNAANIITNLMNSENEAYLIQINLSNNAMAKMEKNGVKVFEELIKNNKIYFKIIPNNVGGFLNIFGSKQDLLEVRDSIEKHIQTIESMAETVFSIPIQYKKNFLTRDKDGGTLLKKLSQEYQNIRIILEDDIQKKQINIKIKGKTEISRKLESEIQKLVNQWKDSCEDKHYLTTLCISLLLRNNRKILLDLCSFYNVELIISPKYFDLKSSGIDTSAMKFAVTCRGSESCVKKFRSSLNDLDIVEKEIDLTFKQQELLSSSFFPHFRHLKYELIVDVILGMNKEPPQQIILIKGLKYMVEKAEEYINNMKKNTCIETITINSDNIGKIIGKNGQSIKEFRKRHNNIHVIIPKENSIRCQITIIGVKENCLSAIEELKKFAIPVKDKDCVKVDLHIGAKKFLLKNEKKMLRELQNKHKVTLTLDSKDPFNPSENTFSLCILGDIKNISNCEKDLKEELEKLIEESENKKLYYAPMDKSYNIDLDDIIKVQNKSNSK